MTDEMAEGKSEQMRSFAKENDIPIIEIRSTRTHAPEFYTYAEVSDATYRFELTMPPGDTVIGHRVAFDSVIEDAKRKIASMLTESYPNWKSMRILHRSEQ